MSSNKIPSDLSPPSNKRKQLHTEEEKQPTKKRQVINPSNNAHNYNNPKNKNNNNRNKNDEKKKENPNNIPLIKSRLMNTTTTPPFGFLPSENLNIEQIEQFVETQPVHTTTTTTSTPPFRFLPPENLNIEQIEQFVETQPVHTTKMSTTILQKSQEELFEEQFVETQHENILENPNEIPIVNPRIIIKTTTTIKSLPPQDLQFRLSANKKKQPIIIQFPNCPFVSMDAQRKGDRFLIKRDFSSGWLMKNKLKIKGILERNEIALDLPQAISLRSLILRSRAIRSHSLVERYAIEVFSLYTKRGRDIKSLGKQFKIPPMILFKSILLSRGWPKSSIEKELETTLRKILKMPPKSVPISKEETTENQNTKMDDNNNNSNTKKLILSHRDKKELLLAHRSDDAAPLVDETLVHAINFKTNVAKFFESYGIEFYTQKELSTRSAHQDASVSTPDLLLKQHQHVIVKLNGHEHRIHWIEVKMTFGSDLPFQQKSIHEQISGYKEHFGFGLLVFSFGCVEKIFKKYLKEGICLCVDSRIVNVHSEVGLIKQKKIKTKYLENA